MTDKCKYSVFTKPSYKWFIFVTKILLASSATTLGTGGQSQATHTESFRRKAV